MKELEEEERQERLGPGGLDPVEVYQSLPKVSEQVDRWSGGVRNVWDHPRSSNGMGGGHLVAHGRPHQNTPPPYLFLIVRMERAARIL